VCITNVDKRSRISQFSLLKEVLDSHGVIIVGLFNDSLYLSEVSKSRTGLDILEVDIWVLSMRQDMSEEEELALV
jgi:hypothetical protein